MAFVPVTYSDGSPVLASGGSQRVACEHLAQWLVTYDALQVARGRGHVTYFQTMGGADASAGTHLCGSAWDMQYTTDAAVMDAREMGAAVWPRLAKYGWTTGEHVHGLILCGDNSCNRYQYDAYWNGYNGLGLLGQGAGDPLPKPSRKRTWQEGIAWAQAEIARLTQPTQEDDMLLFYDAAGTGWVASATRMVKLTGANQAQAVAKMRAGGQLSAEEFAIIQGLQAMLRDPIVPQVKLAGTNTIYAVTADGLVQLTGSNIAAAMAALTDGGTVTTDQRDLASAVLSQGPAVAVATAAIDPAALKAAFDAYFAGATFTTRKA